MNTVEPWSGFVGGKTSVIWPENAGNVFLVIPSTRFVSVDGSRRSEPGTRLGACVSTVNFR